MQMPLNRAFASLFTDFLPFGKKSNPVKGENNNLYIKKVAFTIKKVAFWRFFQSKKLLLQSKKLLFDFARPLKMDF